MAEKTQMVNAVRDNVQTALMALDKAVREVEPREAWEHILMERLTNARYHLRNIITDTLKV